MGDFFNNNNKLILLQIKIKINNIENDKLPLNVFIIRLTIKVYHIY